MRQAVMPRNPGGPTLVVWFEVMQTDRLVSVLTVRPI
jgi:hypothetical protein